MVGPGPAVPSYRTTLAGGTGEMTTIPLNEAFLALLECFF